MAMIFLNQALSVFGTHIDAHKSISTVVNFDDGRGSGR
jgi:hypothetical protein